MDFARKILGKYGWKDGEGLGKHSNGIAKPLRATFKFDNAGFGADQAASDFNNHWWERVFNDAANNVNVKQDGETIKMDLIDNDDSVEISTKGYSMKKLRKAKQNRGSITEQKSESTYNNFLQAATLTNTGGEMVNPDRIVASDIEVTKVKVLTDEELFKACGGRTAHKGARHGLKLSGKLARIQQQEEELLAKMLANRNCTAEEQDKNKKKIKEKPVIEDFRVETPLGEQKDTRKQDKKTRKLNSEDHFDGIEFEDQGNKKKMKKKIKEKTDVKEDFAAETPIKEHKATRKQDRKKRKLTSEDTAGSVTSAAQEFKKKKNYNTSEEKQNSDINEPISGTKSKKKKNKHQVSNISEVATCLNDDLALKSKKKQKKDVCVIDEASEVNPDNINKTKKRKKKTSICRE